MDQPTNSQPAPDKNWLIGPVRCKVHSAQFIKSMYCSCDFFGMIIQSVYARVGGMVPGSLRLQGDSHLKGGSEFQVVGRRVVYIEQHSLNPSWGSGTQTSQFFIPLQVSKLETMGSNRSRSHLNSITPHSPCQPSQPTSPVAPRLPKSLFSTYYIGHL